MPSDPPLISVILPVHNGERFLAEAIRSILDQAYTPLEIIVVDDGSTDGTRDIVEAFVPAIRYEYRGQAGPAAARNRGLDLASGSLIAFLDADDMWTPGKLRRQVAAFEADPSLDIVQGLTQEAYLRDETAPTPSFRCRHDPLVSVSFGSALFRAGVFEKVGRLDPTLWYGEDMDWFLCARDLGVKIVVLDSVLQIARRHGRNMTWGKNVKETNMLRVLKRSIDRRRSQKAGLLSAAVPRFSDFLRTEPPDSDSHGSGTSA